MTTNRWNLRLQQMRVFPGHPVRNTETILAAMDAAVADGVNLLVFPEMAIPGYLLGDEWERPAFLRECVACGEAVRDAARNLCVVFGNVAVDPERRNQDGRIRKYNALFAAQAGRFVMPDHGMPYPFIAKTLMPNYREFDDSRHFYDNVKLARDIGRSWQDLIVPLTLDGRRVGAMLCEDAWDADYGFAPAGIMADKGAELLVLINCSPYTRDKAHKRTRLFRRLARQLQKPVFYVNNVGLQDNGKTVYTFDGGSAVWGPDGNGLKGPAPFAEGHLSVTWPADTHRWKPIQPRHDSIADIDQALVYGIGTFLERMGIHRVVVGISGGIDSAVVAALHRRVLQPRDLLLVTMPSRHNSRRTLSAARRLAESLGCLFAEAPIDRSVALTRDQFDGLSLLSPGGREAGRLELNDRLMENVQARDRSARVLALVAAAFGGVFTCNANKSEITVGYTTLYGDLGGYLAPIADLWKGDVYRLAHYMNEEIFAAETIPADSLAVIPSAELSAEQDVEQGLGDPFTYSYHDALFRSWVESWERSEPEDILEWYRQGTLEKRIAYDGRVDSLFATTRDFIDDLERWWNAYQGLGIAKRIQAPPILAVSRRAFGFDHREAQLGPRYTRRYVELKQRLLAESS